MFTFSFISSGRGWGGDGTTMTTHHSGQHNKQAKKPQNQSIPEVQENSGNHRQVVTAPSAVMGSLFRAGQSSWVAPLVGRTAPGMEHCSLLPLRGYRLPDSPFPWQYLVPATCRVSQLCCILLRQSTKSLKSCHQGWGVYNNVQVQPFLILLKRNNSDISQTSLIPIFHCPLSKDMEFERGPKYFYLFR